jgi:hypothetical protein
MKTVFVLFLGTPTISFPFLSPEIYNTVAEILVSRVVLPFLGLFILCVICLGISKLFKLVHPILLIIIADIGLYVAFPAVRPVVNWAIIIIIIAAVLLIFGLSLISAKAEIEMEKLKNGTSKKEGHLAQN